MSHTHKNTEDAEKKEEDDRPFLLTDDQYYLLCWIGLAFGAFLILTSVFYIMMSA